MPVHVFWTSKTERRSVTQHVESADVVVRWLRSASDAYDLERLDDHVGSIAFYLCRSIHPSPSYVYGMIKHIVTASYISPAMRALHDQYVRPRSISSSPYRSSTFSAKSANIVLLNEIGLDPGIDHCSALSLLRQLEKENKRVLSFTSFCGGLPAPAVLADVPLGNLAGAQEVYSTPHSTAPGSSSMERCAHHRYLGFTLLYLDLMGHGDPRR